MLNLLIIEEEQNLRNQVKLIFPETEYNPGKNFDLIVVDCDFNNQSDPIHCACVVTSDQQFLHHSKISAEQVITCGMSEQDTVSYSSLDELSAQIVLKRAFFTISKQVILPCEIKISLNAHLSESQNLLFSVLGIFYEK